MEFAQGFEEEGSGIVILRRGFIVIEIDALELGIDIFGSRSGREADKKLRAAVCAIPFGKPKWLHSLGLEGGVGEKRLIVEIAEARQVFDNAGNGRGDAVRENKVLAD